MKDTGTREQGFSLIELMVVVAIMGILAAVATPAYVTHLYRVREDTAVQRLMDIKLAQEKYYTLYDQYATSSTDANFIQMLDFSIADTSMYLYSIANSNPAVDFTATVQADLNQDGVRASCWQVDESAAAPTQITAGLGNCAANGEGFRISLLTNLF